MGGRGSTRPGWRRTSPLAGALVIVVASLGAAQAVVPGTPGVPQDPVPVYSEDFSSGTPSAGATPVPLNQYTGGAAANGSTYFASPDWLPGFDACNGWIMNFGSVVPTTAQDAGCNVNGGQAGNGTTQTAWWFQQRMAQTLGLAQGQAAAAAATNNAVTNMTNSHTAQVAGSTQLQTTNAGQTIAGHYYQASIYFAALHCHSDNSIWTDALENVDLLVNGTTLPVVSRLNPCTNALPGFNPFLTTLNTPVRVARIASQAIRITQAANLGLRIFNSTTAFTGNDLAFDLPQVTDVTPQLDKAFDPTEVVAGQPTTLTFTITNTTDLLAKPGWSFTDVLPSGLAVTSGTLPTSTCPNFSRDVPDGGTRLTVGGSLAQGMTSCTVTVSVTPSAPGTFVNGPGNVETNGLWPPGESTLTAEPSPTPSLHLTKTSSPFTVTGAGQAVTFTYTVTNNGTPPVTFTGIVETDFTGTGPLDVVCPDAPVLLLTGEQTTCSATYQTTQADIDAGRITNTAEAEGTDEDGGTVTSPPWETHVDAVQSPRLALVKTVSPQVVHRAGQTVTYSFVVTNTGNVTIGGIRIRETGFTGTGTLPAATCPRASLAPGASMTCTARYAVTQRDIDRGSVRNTAVAIGGTPGRATVQSGPSRAPLTSSPPPTVRTRTSRTRVIPGAPFSDRIRVSGLPAGHVATAVARLHGPFASRASATCGPQSVAASRSVRVRNGWNRTPAVRVRAPGIYTWQVAITPDSVTQPATHRCGQVAETTLVAKPVFRAPVINGGFSGTIGSPGLERRVPLVIRMPGVGMDATVVPERIAQGQMVLPGDVGEVGWLRKSAGVGDKIGTAVVGGHVSDRHDSPGAMFRLGSARAGQVITVVQGGQRHRFKVIGKATFDRGRRLPQRYFHTSGPHRLALISCTDKVVFPNGHFHYTRYLVVLAKALRR
jgi:uncharacterized repeat protein (TIGR01451 family)